MLNNKNMIKNEKKFHLKYAYIIYLYMYISLQILNIWHYIYPHYWYI